MATSMVTQQKPGLSLIFAEKYGIEQSKVFAILKDTALKSKDPISDAEVAAFMVVCNQYDLNPFIKEIFGFISKGKMQYVISVDGWATLINRQKLLNGIEFFENFNGERIQSITCKIHRKDRALPTVVTEYYSECKGGTDTWSKWPIRMLRHKALIQCARLAFGLAGVMDEDEAERMAGYPSPPPILEVAKRLAPLEVEQQMTELGWAEQRKRIARETFSDNPGSVRETIRREFTARGQQPVQQETEQEQAGDDQAYNDAPDNSYSETEHSQESEPLTLQPEETKSGRGRKGEGWL